MVSALTYRPGKGGLHLAQRIDEILERLSAYHFGHINRLAVFQSILAAGKTEIRTSDWETLAKKLGSNVSIAVDAAEVALESAARFLYEDLDVPGDKFLPYSSQMVLLSEFFHRCPKPNKTQKQILRKWFWVTSLSGWFAGANTTHIRYALEEMRGLAENEKKELNVMRLDDPARPFPLRFDARSARVRALCIFMLKMKPLDLASGKPLKVEVTFREYGMSYIFSHISSPLVSNPANRILINKKPGFSAKEQLTALADNLFSDESKTEKRDRILESHYIPQEAYEALLRNDARGFIESRARHIAQCERDFMESLGITLPKDTYPEESDYVEYDADADTDF